MDRLVKMLVGWSVGRSVGRLVGWLVGWLVGRSVGSLVGWLAVFFGFFLLCHICMCVFFGEGLGGKVGEQRLRACAVRYTAVYSGLFLRRKTSQLFLANSVHTQSTSLHSSACSFSDARSIHFGCVLAAELGLSTAVGCNNEGTPTTFSRVS